MQLKLQEVITHKEDQYMYQADTSSHKIQIMVILVCSVSSLVVYPGMQPCVASYVLNFIQVLPEVLSTNSELKVAEFPKLALKTWCTT